MPVGTRPMFVKSPLLFAATCLAGVAALAGPAAAQQYGGSTPTSTASTPAPPPAAAPIDVVQVAASCDRFAAPNGSDSAPGTASAPFRTAQKLQDSLSAGQTGCLKPGAVFTGRLRGNKSGQNGRPIVMTSGPGSGRATILGEIYIPDGTSDITYLNLVINGRDAFRVNPSVNGDRITFRNNEITDERNGICFHIGKPGEGVAEGIIIDGNRIHGCGRLPATGFDHGVYLNTTRNVRITNNYIYDNADYGIHLYPNAQNTYIANNVIDGNGRGITFSGEGGTASSGNVVVNNIISNSKDTTNIESYWGGPVGTGNRADDNCLWNGAKGNIGAQRGFSLSGNRVANPMFVNRAAANFALLPGSPCAGKGPGNPLPGGGGSGGSGGGSGGSGGASGGGAPAPAVKAARLKLGTSWIASNRLRVSATVRVAGRVTMSARIGRRVVGSCTRRAPAGRKVSCVFTSRSRVTVTVSLRPNNTRLGITRKKITRNPK